MQTFIPLLVAHRQDERPEKGNLNLAAVRVAGQDRAAACIGDGVRRIRVVAEDEIGGAARHVGHRANGVVPGRPKIFNACDPEVATLPREPLGRVIEYADAGVLQGAGHRRGTHGLRTGSPQAILVVAETGERAKGRVEIREQSGRAGAVFLTADGDEVARDDHEVGLQVRGLLDASHKVRLRHPGA